MPPIYRAMDDPYTALSDTVGFGAQNRRSQVVYSTSPGRPRSARAASTAARIDSTGAVSPVQSVNAKAAIWVSIDTPFAHRTPAEDAALTSGVSNGE